MFKTTQEFRDLQFHLGVNDLSVCRWSKSQLPRDLRLEWSEVMIKVFSFKTETKN